MTFFGKKRFKLNRVLVNTLGLTVLVSSALADVMAPDGCQNQPGQFDAALANADEVYAMAVCQSRSGNEDQAFEYLSAALDKGYVNADWVMADPALERLHQDERWMPLLIKFDRRQQQHLLAQLERVKS